jgi:Zn-dependent peptidase ImmA (M78 family)
MSASTIKIDALVRKILSDCQVDAPPIDVLKIAKNYNAKVQFGVLPDDISGFVYSKGDQLVIGVNVKHPPVRQRFTIAHELGHYLLNHLRNDVVHVDRNFSFRFRDAESGKGEFKDEIYANAFAASLLMPHKFLEKDLARSKPLDYIQSNHVARLAQKYKVSTQALTIRLGSLGQSG